MTSPYQERQKAYKRNYFQQNKEYFYIYKALKYLGQKALIFKLLGNKCAMCGCTDKRVLQIDHINGGGLKEKRNIGDCRERYRYILKKIQNGSKEYQLLCANCNWIKRWKNKEGNEGSKYMHKFKEFSNFKWYKILKDEGWVA